MCLLSYFSFSYGRVPIATSITVCWVQDCCAQRDQGKFGSNSILCGLFWWSLITEFKVDVSLTCDFKVWSSLALNHCWKETAPPQTTFLSPYYFQMVPHDCTWQRNVRKNDVGLFWTKWIFSLLTFFPFLLPEYRRHEALLDGCVKRWWNIILRKQQMEESCPPTRSTILLVYVSANKLHCIESLKLCSLYARS